VLRFLTWINPSADAIKQFLRRTTIAAGSGRCRSEPTRARKHVSRQRRRGLGGLCRLASWTSESHLTHPPRRRGRLVPAREGQHRLPSGATRVIHSTFKRYHIALWETEERSTGPGVKYEFESLSEALALFDEQRRGGRYRGGVLFQWLRDGDDWQLIDRFPR
jgi:hypothetical protein